MYIYYFPHEYVDSLSDEKCLQAKMVYIDWKKDIFIEETFDMSYCEYMVEIIDHLIVQQEIYSDVNNLCSSKSPDMQISTNTCTNTDSQVPHFIDFCLFVYLGFYVAFNTVQVISRRVVGRAEETST